MPGHSPAGPLMQEHRVIERMVALLRRELESIANTGRADTAFLDSAADFIHTYADLCHHGKEEHILFSLLAERELDPALTAEMAELIQDHVLGRKMTGDLVDANRRYAAGDETVLAEVQGAIRALADFYPLHIAKEDKHFFKAALQEFTADELDQILLDFDEFDRGVIHLKYRGMVEELEARR